MLNALPQAAETAKVQLGAGLAADVSGGQESVEEESEESFEVEEEAEEESRQDRPVSSPSSRISSGKPRESSRGSRGSLGGSLAAQNGHEKHQSEEGAEVDDEEEPSPGQADKLGNDDGARPKKCGRKRGIEKRKREAYVQPTKSTRISSRHRHRRSRSRR